MTTTRYPIGRMAHGAPVLDLVERSPLGDQRERYVVCARPGCMTRTLNIGGVCNHCTPCDNARLDESDPERCTRRTAAWFCGTRPLCQQCIDESLALYVSPIGVSWTQGVGWFLTTGSGDESVLLDETLEPLSLVEAIGLRRVLEGAALVRTLSAHPVALSYEHGDYSSALLTWPCCIDGTPDHGCCLHGGVAQRTVCGYRAAGHPCEHDVCPEREAVSS